MSKSLVKGLTGDAAGQLTGRSLLEKLNEIKLTKSTAIQVIAISAALNYGRKDQNVVKNAKNYLLNRCVKSSSYTDSETGVTLITTDVTRTDVTSDKIKKLEDQIKAEKAKIKKEAANILKGRKITDEHREKLAKKFAGAEITYVPRTNWTLGMNDE